LKYSALLKTAKPPSVPASLPSAGLARVDISVVCPSASSRIRFGLKFAPVVSVSDAI
jgi:hypothetical protein